MKNEIYRETAHGTLIEGGAYILRDGTFLFQGGSYQFLANSIHVEAVWNQEERILTIRRAPVGESNYRVTHEKGRNRCRMRAPWLFCDGRLPSLELIPFHRVPVPYSIDQDSLRLFMGVTVQDILRRLEEGADTGSTEDDNLD